MASLVKRPGSSFWYIQYYENGTLQRKSTGIKSRRVAETHLVDWQYEHSRPQGQPTATPLAKVVTDYVEDIRLRKTAKSAQTDVYYLREVFGPLCPALQITSRKVGPDAKKRQVQPATDGTKEKRTPFVRAKYIEEITTGQVKRFINAQAKSRQLAPKTLNRYREVLHAMFEWAMTQDDIRLPRERNPIKAVKRFRERAPKIRFLSLKQIQQQLDALADDVQMQTMVAVLIYAGLRREELLWLTPADIRLKAGLHGMIRVRAKRIGGESWQPKTAINRAVPISSALRVHLDRYHTERVPGKWYFPNSRSGRWDPDNWSSELRAVNFVKKLGWPLNSCGEPATESEDAEEDEAESETQTDENPTETPDNEIAVAPFGCLDFRHTFGSQLASNNISLQKIALMMGNSPEICRRHYAAVIPETCLDIVEFQPARVTEAARDARPATP